jgi:hypothetical protein
MERFCDDATTMAEKEPDKIGCSMTSRDSQAKQVKAGNGNVAMDEKKPSHVNVNGARKSCFY